MKNVNEQVKDVRAALKAAGYQIVVCKHESGSAYNWIRVSVVYPGEYVKGLDGRWSDEYNAYYDKVFALVKQSSGRGNLEDDSQSDLFRVNINVNVLSKEQYAAELKYAADHKAKILKNKTCPACGNVVAKFSRLGYRFIRECQCGQKWAHGSA